MSELSMPEIIYLQGDGSDENTTWCDERIDDDDTEYIRKDKYDTLRAENELLRKALDGLLHIVEEHGTPLQKAHATKLLEAREALEVKG